MIELRDVQVPLVQKMLEYFKQPSKGCKPSLGVAPTAYGKSIVISSVAHTIGEGVIVIQPSAELLEQNYAKLLALGGQASIYSASLNSKEIGPLTYATIQSIYQLGGSLKKRFKYGIVDEADCQSVESKGMLRRFFREAGIKHVVGLTATPFKLLAQGSMYDNYSILKMLTDPISGFKYYSDILHVCQVKEMIDGNYWSKINYDVRNVKELAEKYLKYNSNKSDFTDESLALAFSKLELKEKILCAIEGNPDRKSRLVAVPGIQRANEIADSLPNAVAIHSRLAPKERKRVVDAFRALEIETAVVDTVLTIGFDHPPLDHLIAARPTASLAKWYQYVGRGTRLYEGKQDVLLTDLVGNTSRFGMIEELEYVKEEDGWKLYGENSMLLTGVRFDQLGMHTKATEAQRSNPNIITFGRYTGKEIKDIPKEYRDALLEAGDFRRGEEGLKKELMRLESLGI